MLFLLSLCIRVHLWANILNLLSHRATRRHSTFGCWKLSSNAKVRARCLQVAEALGQMRGGEAIHAFQLDDQNVFNYQVRVKFPNELPLVSNRIRDLCDRRDPSKSQLVHQCPLVQLFQKARAQGIGDFKSRSNNGFGEPLLLVVDAIKISLQFAHR
jgi:hypothetical protein